MIDATTVFPAHTNEAPLGVALKRLHFRLQAEWAQSLAETGLRVGAAQALITICETPGLRQTELSLRLAIERSNLVAIVDTLVARGLIVRRILTRDRRCQALVPTDAGHDMARHLH